MLNCGGDNMLALVTCSPQDATQGEIVTFGATAGEQDLGRARLQKCRYSLPSFFQSLLCPPPSPVHTGWITKVSVEVRQHGFQYLCPQRGGCIMVKVDCLHSICRAGRRKIVRSLGRGIIVPTVCAAELHKSALAEIFFAEPLRFLPHAHQSLQFLFSHRDDEASAKSKLVE